MTNLKIIELEEMSFFFIFVMMPGILLLLAGIVNDSHAMLDVGMFIIGTGGGIGTILYDKESCADISALDRGHDGIIVLALPVIVFCLIGFQMWLALTGIIVGSVVHFYLRCTVSPENEGVKGSQS